MKINDLVEVVGFYANPYWNGKKGVIVEIIVVDRVNWAIVEIDGVKTAFEFAMLRVI